MRSRLKPIVCTALVLILLSSVTLVGFASSPKDVAAVTHDNLGYLSDALKNSRYDKDKIISLKIDAKVDFDYDDWDVVANLNNIFPNLQNLVVTGGGVTIVTSYAFNTGRASKENNFKKLTSIQMTDVHTIEVFAFQDCVSLEYVDFPELLDMEGFVFDGCKNLKYINMPKVQNLDNYVFSECISIENVYMPNLNVLGSSAFDGCTALVDAYIPSATYIGDQAFYGCSKLKNVNMVSAENIAKRAFDNCNSLEIAIMPNVKKLGTQAFMFCSNLEEYVFGSEVPTLPTEYHTQGTYEAPTYHIFGDKSDYRNFRLDPDHVPNIIGYGAEFDGEEIFSVFSDYEFEENISYSEYLNVDFDKVYAKKSYTNPFIYNPRVIPRFFRYFTMYIKLIIQNSMI